MHFSHPDKKFITRVKSSFPSLLHSPPILLHAFIALGSRELESRLSMFMKNLNEGICRFSLKDIWQIFLKTQKTSHHLVVWGFHCCFSQRCQEWRSGEMGRGCCCRERLLVTSYPRCEDSCWWVRFAVNMHLDWTSSFLPKSSFLI